jgi:hypothetical protein
MYSYNDYRLYLEHSWGKKPEQKAAEKAYNQKYYQEHKSKWAEYRENAANALGFDDKKKFDEAEAEYLELKTQFDDLYGQMATYFDDKDPSNLTPQQKREYEQLSNRYYQVLDKYNAASSKMYEARRNYQKNGSLARVIDDGPVKTAKRVGNAIDNKVSDVVWDVQDKVDEISGSKARRNVQNARAEYKRKQDWADLTGNSINENTSKSVKKWHDYDVEQAKEAKARYEQALDEYGDHPIGRLQNTFGVLTGKKKVRY